jgi:hypothetical protein
MVMLSRTFLTVNLCVVRLSVVAPQVGKSIPGSSQFTSILSQWTYSWQFPAKFFTTSTESVPASLCAILCLKAFAESYQIRPEL